MAYFYTIEKCLKYLTIVGIHPEKGYAFPQIVLFVVNLVGVNIMFTLVLLNFFYNNISKTVTNVTDAASYLLLFAHGLLKSSTMFLTKQRLLKLIKAQEKWNHDEYTDDQKIQKYYKVIKLTFFFILGMHMINVVGFDVIGDGTLPIECYIPNWLNFYTLLIIQHITAFQSIVFPVVTMDIIFMSILRLTQIQFRRLNLEMRKMFDEHGGVKKNIISERLRTCIRKHNDLLRYANEINDAFSKSLLIFLVIIVLSMCVEMYVLTTQFDWLSYRKALTYTATGCIQFMLCYCYPCQGLMDEIEDLYEAIYFSKWYNHLDSKETVIMLIRGQHKFLIRPGGLIHMNLPTGLTTLKTMVSYAMFLKSISKTENALDK